jgi:CBS domain containing-hemolysin-like protein
MFLLCIFVFIVLGFSFLCSIAEAVLLSTSTAHISVLERDNKPSGPVLRGLKDDINSPLAAILTLNTIAHTVGAAGAGAQATLIFGSAYLGIISAILTLLILIFSEIIPKTLGAHYWRQLAPATGYCLRILIWILYPFVWLAKKLTGSLSEGPTLKGFSRGEFAAIAELSEQEGQLDKREMHIMHNMLSLKELSVTDVMTPRPVIFALPDTMTVSEFTVEHEHEPFSRILIYSGNKDSVTGFVLRSDLLLAQAQGQSTTALSEFQRELPAIVSKISILRAFDELLKLDTQIMLVVNEYGVIEGLITLEDIVETLLGIEIIDEVDKTKDLRQLARRFGRRRARSLGLNDE